MHLRLFVGTMFAVWMVGRPVRLASVRWWRSPDVAESISLTTAQRETIELMYEQRLAGRRRCVERVVQATNRVDQLLRDGVYDEHLLRETQAVAGAAREERVLLRILSEEIVAMLTTEQRERLVKILHGRIVE